ncbi:MAG TPA: zf-HC2 domain-containing protein [Thermoanaerobaculia bacterium]|nr:zf-HC2 domain-containing protein [Thermoanaerobaculia bacterium]
MNLNCDQVAELLPWYLNGTLDEGEQGEVRVHLEGCTKCRQALDETRLAWRIYDQHIPSEALVALGWGETPEGLDPDVLERHLETCPQCAAELEMVRTSRKLEEDDRIAVFPTLVRPARTERSAPGWRTAAMAAGLAGIVAASGWVWTAGRANDLEERLALADRPPETTPETSPAPDGGGRLAEMTAEVERLQRREAELRQQQEEMQEQLARIAQASPAAPSPQINAWIGDLRPTQDVVRGGSATAEELPAGRTASLILGTSHKETHRGHRVEIVDSAGKVVWSADGLVPDGETNDYGITLPAGTLKPGAYTIRISAQEDGKRVELESYSVRVR